MYTVLADWVFNPNGVVPLAQGLRRLCDDYPGRLPPITNSKRKEASQGTGPSVRNPGLMEQPRWGRNRRSIDKLPPTNVTLTLLTLGAAKCSGGCKATPPRNPRLASGKGRGWGGFAMPELPERNP